MKIPEHESSPDIDPILPLINVVFLLLIFFMMVGALHATDILEIEPPSSASQLPDAAGNDLVLLGADGRLAMANQAVDESDLRSMVQDYLRDHPGSVIRLKADGQVEANRVVEVMELLRAAGAEEMVLLTLGSDR